MNDEELTAFLRDLPFLRAAKAADRIEALIDAPDVTELVGAAKALMARWPTDQHSASPLYEEAQRLRAAVAKLKGEKG
jgi:hypothetical protein